MFSGIIEEAAVVTAVHQSGGIMRFEVKSALDHSGTAVGDSIALDGVCLTVTSIREASLQGAILFFDGGSETLRRTTLGSLKPGDKANLERSLRVGSRLHGHFVTGHVDGTARLLERRSEGATEVLVWDLPPHLGPYVAAKGSIAVGGVSLTVGEVEHSSFSVYIIPHTSLVTTLLSYAVGRSANLEIDVLSRYVCNAIKHREGSSDAEFLQVLEKSGFLPGTGH